jgi:hypothetical protein
MDGGGGTQDGTFSKEGLRSGGVRSGAEFAVDFVLVDVRQELVEQAVGAFELEDLIGSQEGRLAFLPVVVTGFDLAFGLRCRGVAESDAVEVGGLTDLGEGVGVVRGEVVFAGPAANAGAVGFKIQSAMPFAGTSAVGRGRFGSEEFFEQGDDVLGPIGMVIAAGNAWRPNPGLTLGAGAKILAVELVEAGA